MGNGVVHDGDGRTYQMGRKLGSGTTNDKPDSCITCTVTCEDQWSLVQLETIGLLSERGQLLESVVPRAKRTAGHYAALFLADEGRPSQGRFYWPGLAAFAAKQVVDGIEYAQQNMGAFLAQVRAMAGISLYYLLKGNFWVFIEVTPWKIFYKERGHEAFFHCIERRDVTTYDTRARSVVRALPWASGENSDLRSAIERRVRALNIANLSWSRLGLQDSAGALAEMSQCRVTSFLRDGFNKLRQAETQAQRPRKAQLLYESAWSFLLHEQTLHLQKMIYDHPDFQFAWDNNDFGREINDRIPITGARDPDLLFNAAASRDARVNRELAGEGLGPDDVSVRMPLADGKLYDAAQRMVYVRRILDQYHFLMQGKHRAYMVRQLRTIEAWKDAT